jgi:hypothetical protein
LIALSQYPPFSTSVAEAELAPTAYIFLSLNASTDSCCSSIPLILHCSSPPTVTSFASKLPPSTGRASVKNRTFGEASAPPQYIASFKYSRCLTFGSVQNSLYNTQLKDA